MSAKSSLWVPSSPLPPVDMDYIRERCTCEDGGCWEWTLGTNKGSPYLHINRRDEEGNVRPRFFYVRHLSWWLKKGKRAELGRYYIMAAKCGNPLCVNPAHLRIDRRGSQNKGKSKSVTMQINLAQSRRKNSKLSDADVAAIRESDEDALTLSQRYGVSRAYIYMLLRGQWRRDYRNNPFAGLMA